MNTSMTQKRTFSQLPIALLLAGLVGSGTLAAQDSLNRSDLPRPSEDRSSCRDVNWNQALLTRYPWALDSCQEVVMVDGEKWARFEAKFQRMNRNGTFDVDFLNRQGRSLGVVSLKPGTNQTVLLDNREYAFSELRQNQKLNFYVPEGTFGFAVEPGAASNEMVEVVEPRAPAAEPVRLARAEPRPARTETATLPATAGPMPLFALSGLLAMLSGLGMTIRRRSSGSAD